jgi:cyclophilin family peptidyl-prolyl cis-trans isomerase
VRRFLWLLLFLALATLPGCGSDNPVVAIDTSMGTIKVELFESAAPKTVKNFLDYVDAKHYDETYFHRVIKNFVVQGGAEKPNGEPKRKTRDPIKNESYNGLLNERGTVSMGLLEGNPNSATDQFFINLKHNTHLDRSNQSVGFCVFGKVIEGMDVVDKIQMVETNQQGSPLEPITIKSIRRVQPK